MKLFHLPKLLCIEDEGVGFSVFTHATWREFRSHDISLGSAGGVAFIGVSAFMMTGGSDASADSMVLGAGARAGAAGGCGGGAAAPMMPRSRSCWIRDMGSDAGGAAGAAAAAGGGVGVGTAGVGVVFRDGSACFCCASSAASAPFPRSESIVREP